LAATLLASAGVALAAATPAADAKTVTLHLYSKATSSTFVDPHGHPIKGPPAVGDTFDDMGVDFVGDHTHHAAKSNGSDHLRCTITAVGHAGPTALCNGQIAICGSMILANDESFTLSQSAPPTQINGGTGIYRHAHGLITPTNVGNNTDFVIKVTY
jgi:hypothetical protein